MKFTLVEKLAMRCFSAKYSVLHTYRLILEITTTEELYRARWWDRSFGQPPKVYAKFSEGMWKKILILLLFSLWKSNQSSHHNYNNYIS